MHGHMNVKHLRYSSMFTSQWTQHEIPSPKQLECKNFQKVNLTELLHSGLYNFKKASRLCFTVRCADWVFTELCSWGSAAVLPSVSLRFLKDSSNGGK